MSDDTISRQAAIGYIDRVRTTGMGKKQSLEYIRLYIEKLPSVQPERWIPVSERLPDVRDERYLVSLAWGGIGVMEYKSTGFHNYGYFTPVPIESVIAWMPLPEPYKGEQ